jgi:succinate-acetate transporter protein
MATYAATKQTAAEHGNGRRILSPSVFLQPLAPPASIGLFGFFLATTMVSTWLLGWWGDPLSMSYVFMFAGAMGGLVQFIAGMWSFRARDYIASGILSMWGTFWMAWALFQFLVVDKLVPLTPVTVSQPGYAIWFIPLGLFTLLGAFAGLSPKHGAPSLFALLFTTGVGSLLLCIGLWTGIKPWTEVAAWWLLVCGCLGWYVASQFMLRSAWRRTVFPFGSFSRDGMVPGRRVVFPTEHRAGQPGVSQGTVGE